MNLVRICSSPIYSSRSSSCRSSFRHFKIKFLDHHSIHLFYSDKFSFRSISTTFSKLFAETHYHVLGLKSNCTQKEIRLAYLELCKRHHPDRFRQNPDDQTENKLKFQQINDAYSNLSSPSKRAEYDWKLNQRYSPVDSSYFYRPSAYNPGNNASYHHQYYQHRNPFDRQNATNRTYKKFKLDTFTTTFSAAVFICLIIVLILQSINSIIEIQMFEEHTKRRYKTIAEIYYKQQSLNNKKKNLDFIFSEEEQQRNSSAAKTSDLPDCD